MSWSIVVEETESYQLDQPEMEKLLATNLSYLEDAQIALRAAKQMKLRSCTIAGGRTPNPYGTDEIVTITVQGFGETPDFLATMQRIVTRQ